MGCERISELLPWLLNASLEGDERREVEEHLAGCESCRRELEETGRALGLYATHPPVKALVAYAEDPRAPWRPAEGGALAPEVLEAHLAHCPSCREELVLVRESRAAMASAATPAAGDTVVAFAPATARRRRPAGTWRGLALAASLTLAVAATAGWFQAGRVADLHAQRVAELEGRVSGPLAGQAAGEVAGLDVLERQVAEARERAALLERQLAATGDQLAAAGERLAALESARPGLRSGATVSFLVRREVLRGGPPGEDVEVVPGGGGEEVVFFLDLSELADEAGPYRVSLEDEEGGTVLQRDGLVPVTTALGPQLTLVIPTASLPHGPLTLRLRADGREVAAIPFRLAP